jgi:hypothetical protein
MPPAESGPDRDRVVDLRRQALERAGFRGEHAAALAERLDIDLQHALSLPKQGFPPEVAYDLLLTGSRPVF